MLKRTSLLLVGLFVISLTIVRAQTQSAMNVQTRAEFEQADSELTKTYDALLGRLPDAESKRKLQESQRAWIAFRDAEGSFAADQVRGGTAASSLRYASMTECTQQRIKQLKSDFPR
jgi:uncharacterized protein YecT (DUF1311 family)